MNATESFDVIVLGGGTAGKLMAWTMAREGRRTAGVDRKYVGGSCPNGACLLSKNVIHSAKVASLAARQGPLDQSAIEPAPPDRCEGAMDITTRVRRQ